MRGRLPKSPGMRSRANRGHSGAMLPSVADSAENAVPALSRRDDGAAWHVRVTEWWAAVWRSPMAAEYLPSDRRGLEALALLHHDFWTASGPRERVALASEIRLQESRFGLSPVDRRRLQWIVERAELAEQRTEARRNAEALRQVAAGAKDPRAVLRMVTEDGK